MWYICKSATPECADIVSVYCHYGRFELLHEVINFLIYFTLQCTLIVKILIIPLDIGMSNRPPSVTRHKPSYFGASSNLTSLTVHELYTIKVSNHQILAWSSDWSIQSEFGVLRLYNAPVLLSANFKCSLFWHILFYFYKTSIQTI